MAGSLEVAAETSANPREREEKRGCGVINETLIMRNGWVTSLFILDMK